MPRPLSISAHPLLFLLLLLAHAARHARSFITFRPNLLVRSWDGTSAQSSPSQRPPLPSPRWTVTDPTRGGRLLRPHHGNRASFPPPTQSCRLASPPLLLWAQSGGDIDDEGGSGRTVTTAVVPTECIVSHNSPPTEAELAACAAAVGAAASSSSCDLSAARGREEGVEATEATSVAEGVLLLNLLAVIWGTQHAIIKTVVTDASAAIDGGGGGDAAAFTLARFGLAALLASPYVPGVSSAGRRLGLPPWPPRLEEGTREVVDKVEQSKGTRDEDAPNGSKGEEGAAATTIVDAGEERGEWEEIRTAWRWGVEMGTWMFLGYAFQAIGLAYTTAQRSGFLLYLNVKFVPFFAAMLFGRTISAATWASALTAFAGTALIALDDQGGVQTGASAADLNVGDLWSVAAAAASAMFILRLESASAVVKNPSQLNAASLWTVTTAALAWSAFTTPFHASGDELVDISAALRFALDGAIRTASSHPVEIVYLGAVTTALANYLQARAQRSVTAERASVIFALDPVYGAFFAYLLLGERLGAVGITGAGLITVAAATNAFLDLGMANEDDVGIDEVR